MTSCFHNVFLQNYSSPTRFVSYSWNFEKEKSYNGLDFLTLHQAALFHMRILKISKFLWTSNLIECFIIYCQFLCSDIILIPSWACLVSSMWTEALIMKPKSSWWMGQWIYFPWNDMLLNVCKPTSG